MMWSTGGCRGRFMALPSLPLHGRYTAARLCCTAFAASRSVALSLGGTAASLWQNSRVMAVVQQCAGGDVNLAERQCPYNGGAV